MHKRFCKRQHRQSSQPGAHMLERRVQGLGEERAIGAVVWGTCEGIFALEQQVGENAEREATLVPPVDLEYAWVRFEFPWDAQPGTHVLLTRATDKKDNTQPERVPF